MTRFFNGQLGGIRFVLTGLACRIESGNKMKNESERARERERKGDRMWSVQQHQGGIVPIRLQQSRAANRHITHTVFFKKMVQSESQRSALTNEQQYKINILMCFFSFFFVFFFVFQFRFFLPLLVRIYRATIFNLARWVMQVEREGRWRSMRGRRGRGGGECVFIWGCTCVCVVSACLCER